MAKEKKEAAAEEAAKISFHAAVLRDDGGFTVESYTTLADLVARLKSLIDKDVSVFAFSGDRLPISKAPYRHLLVPGADPIPLFEVPAQLEPDDSGYLGVDPILLNDPPEIKEPSQPRGGNNGGPPDEFFNDDNTNVLGVFDSVLPDPDS